MARTYPTSIKQAAVLLDSVKPDWFNVIDTTKLSIRCDITCILGQLYGDYGIGMRTLFNTPVGTYTHDTIFGTAAPKADWIIEINNRKGGHDFDWALEQLKAGHRVRRNSWASNYYIIKTGVHIVTDEGKDFSFYIDDFDANNWVLANLVKLYDVCIGGSFKYDGKTYIKVVNLNNQNDCYGLCNNTLTQFIKPHTTIVEII